MLKGKLVFRKIPYSILLVFGIFVLVESVGSVNGIVLRTYYASDYNISNGTYLAGSVPASVQGIDSDYFVVRSFPSATSISAHNPSGYNLLGSTAYVSGTTGDLVSNNGVYMTFWSYASAVSAWTLYSHRETTTVGGVTYYPLNPGSADTAGKTLSADAGTTTGRKLVGKFVYPLTGVSSIPASVWTIYYRVRKGNVQVEAHCDVDILIRTLSGANRTIIATDVANSGAITTSWSTLSGSYSWTAYTVVDQTDYLEIDYYIEITEIQSDFVYLQIDGDTLAVADQTRTANVMLPSEFTTELEFTGTSNTYSWTQLEWTTENAWTTANVSVTLQLYNYTLGAYPTSGNGYISYVSSVTTNTDETKTQTITTNPQHFRNAIGNWKIKVKGVKSTNAQFDFEADLIELHASTQTSSQPLDWFPTLLYVLPLVFVLLFFLALKLKRKKTTASPKPIQAPEGSLGEPKPKKPHIAKKTDAFSQQFGMTHQQMRGKKMLLEFDPTSDYHKALSIFVSEARNSDEMLFILTNKNSILHSAFSGDANVRFLLLTSKTSSPHQINEKETLLPASDLSVLLDAFVRIQKVEPKETIDVLFDNLSDIILRCGFERTYKFIRLLLEAISSPKTTVLFLFNPTAHDQAISSSIRGLFHIKLAYAKSGPKVGTL